MDMVIRHAELKDCEQITEIYNFEVLNSEANYETNPQSIVQRIEWFNRLKTSDYPVLVAEICERVVGFAALTPFHPLSGYRFTVSGSIYIQHSHQGTGVGKKLAQQLLLEAKKRKYHSILAGIQAQNIRSISLLKSFGFEQVGYFKQIGFKNGNWLDDVCLQLVL